MFKVVSLSLDALAQSGYKTVNCCSPVSCRNQSNFSVNSVLHLLDIREQFSLDFLLEQSKQPIIQWIQIRTICWVWHKRYPDLLDPLSHNKGSVSRSTIMENGPAPPAPNLWASASHGISDLSQNFQIKLAIDPLSLRNKVAVHQAKSVKEDDEHGFWDSLLPHWNCWGGGIGWEPCPVVTA